MWSIVTVMAFREWDMGFFLCSQAWQSLMAVVAADARSYTMACMASPFAWIVATVLLIVLYFYVMKDMKRKLCLQ